jgi:hypothetical protein
VLPGLDELVMRLLSPDALALGLRLVGDFGAPDLHHLKTFHLLEVLQGSIGHHRLDEVQYAQVREPYEVTDTFIGNLRLAQGECGQRRCFRQVAETSIGYRRPRNREDFELG